MARLKPLASRLKKIWADGAYGGEPLAKWCQEEGGWDLEVVEPNREAESFEVMPKHAEEMDRGADLLLDWPEP